MRTVASSEIQKNFGEWHDRSFQGPVEITKYGRTTAYLVSASLFRAMWESYRQAVATADLSKGEMDMILSSSVATDQPYDLSDIPDEDDAPAGL